MYTCVCWYTHIHTCIHTWKKEIHICVYTYTGIYMYSYKHRHEYVHAWKITNMLISVYSHMCTYMCSYTHIHACIYTYTLWSLTKACGLRQDINLFEHLFHLPFLRTVTKANGKTLTKPQPPTNAHRTAAVCRAIAATQPPDPCL